MGEHLLIAPPILDTHILLWWRSSPDRLSKQQRRVLVSWERRGMPIGISAISLWELAKLVELGRLRITSALEIWLGEVERNPLIEILPVTARIAAESTQLGPGFHRDPCDQLIVATARVHSRPLATADERIRDWGGVQII